MCSRLVVLQLGLNDNDDSNRACRHGGRSGAIYLSTFAMIRAINGILMLVTTRC